MYRSETGGVCDCGDLESWAEEGCCRVHAPRRSRESKTSIREDGGAAAAAGDDVHANSAKTNRTLPPGPRRDAAEAVIGVVAERLLLALESVARARGGVFFLFFTQLFQSGLARPRVLTSDTLAIQSGPTP